MSRLLTLSLQTVTTLNYVVGDGKSNWMEGAILICEHHRSLNDAGVD